MLIALGVRAYLSRASNIFDGTFVIVSIVDLSLSGSGSAAGAITAFRALRLFRLVYAV